MDVQEGKQNNQAVTIQSNPVLLERREVKTDWYENDDTVTVFLYIKEIAKENVMVKFTESSLEVQFKTRCRSFLETHAKGSFKDVTFFWKLDLLNKVCADSCTYKVYGTKLELKLKKEMKTKWGSLEEDPPMYHTKSAVPPKQTQAEEKQQEAWKSTEPAQRKQATRMYMAQSVASQYLHKQFITEWRFGKRCDAIIKVGQEVVTAHREVLCAVSEFFQGVFPDIRCQSPEQLDFTGVFDSAAVLRDLIGFIYGDAIEITPEKVPGLLKGSTLINLIEFTGHCVYFLLQNLQLENCLWTWNLAAACSLAELENICLEIAQTRFKDTISQLEGTSDLSPDEIFEFMKKGMIKYCTKGDLQKFMTNYFSHNKQLTSTQQALLLDLTGLKKSDIPEKCSNETRQAEKNRGKNDLGTEDTVVIQWKKQKQWFVYRTETDEWLTLPETFASIRYPEERIGVFGAGSEKDLFILVGSPNIKCMNMNTLQISDVPQCPLMGKEKMARETNRKKLIIRCHGNELCCVVYSRIVTDKNASPKKIKKNDWMENLRGKYNSVEMFYVYIQRYSFHRKKWEFDCQVYYGPETVTKLVSLERKNGRMYIVLCGSKDISLYKYNPEDSEAIRMSSYRNESMPSVKDAMIFSTNNSIILSETQGKTLQYDTKSNSWSLLEDFQTEPEQSCIYTASESEGLIYVFKEGITTKSARFFRYDPFTKQVKELCPPPGIPFDQLKMAQNRKISCKTLKCFVPVKMLNDVSETVLSETEIANAMKTYCQSPTEESESDGSNSYRLHSQPQTMDELQMCDEALYREACNIRSNMEQENQNGRTVPGNAAYPETVVEKQLCEEVLREACRLYFEELENNQINQTRSTDEQVQKQMFEEAMLREAYRRGLENKENGRANGPPIPGQFACQQALAEQQMFEEAVMKEAVMRRMFSSSQ